jgi:hypothetical protein
MQRKVRSSSKAETRQLYDTNPVQLADMYNRAVAEGKGPGV